MFNSALSLPKTMPHLYQQLAALRVRIAIRIKQPQAQRQHQTDRHKDAHERHEAAHLLLAVGPTDAHAIRMLRHIDLMPTAASRLRAIHAVRYANIRRVGAAALLLLVRCLVHVERLLAARRRIARGASGGCSACR